MIVATMPLLRMPMLAMIMRAVVMGTMVMAVTMRGGGATALKGLGSDHQRNRHRLLQHGGNQPGEHPGNQGAREYAFEHSVSGMIGQ